TRKTIVPEGERKTGVMRRCARWSFSPISFFFQAEDGIRDRNVTGVQTCALPISRGARAAFAEPRDQGRRQETRVFGHQRHERARSEERRVGKECRCRWAR